MDPRVLREVEAQPYPLLFMTVSGAHLYGFPSPDSDWDLRGAHILPVRDVVGLGPARETIESMKIADGLEIDAVTHDLRKFLEMLLRRNGYVLEQLTSPIVIRTSPAHAELVAMAPRLVTRWHANHYLGFARTQEKLFIGEKKVKPLLYAYRVLLTGLRLARTGEMEANLVKLDEEARLPQLPELIARKLAGPEKGVLEGADVAFHQTELARLTASLVEARDASKLRETVEPETRQAISDLLVRVRLGV
jgi:predicted nucleotidyltransferase